MGRTPKPTSDGASSTALSGSSNTFREGDSCRVWLRGAWRSARVVATGVRNRFLVRRQGMQKREDVVVDGRLMVRDSDRNLVAVERKRSRKDDSGGEKRRKVGKFFEPEDVSVGKLEMELSIPQALKRLLLVDMKHHRSQNVLVLPRTPSAGQVLRDFQDYSSSGCHSLSSFKIPGVALCAEDVLDALGSYFEVALGTRLLYDVEREEFEHLAAEANVLEVYGPEHLLRLLVKLPEFLVHTPLFPDSLYYVRIVLEKLMQFLSKNIQKYFGDAEYIPTHEL